MSDCLLRNIYRMSTIPQHDHALTIRLSSGDRFHVTWEPSAPPPSECTIRHVKEAIHRQHPETPVPSQKLLHKGRILEDHRTLQEYGIPSNGTLFLVVRSAHETPHISEAAATSHRTDTPQEAPPASSTARSPPPPPDTLAALLQNMLGGENSADASQTVPQHPPHLQQLLNDPGALQQAMDLMRHPEALQQAMRQQDLAMSQLENMPGGFSALRSMYDTVHSLEDAWGPPNNTTGTSSTSEGRDNASHESASEVAGATGAAMPNPWGSRGAQGSRAATHRSNGPARPRLDNPFLQALANNQGDASPAGTTGGAPPAVVRPMGQSNSLVHGMMQEFVRANPDTVREMLMQHDPMLGQFLRSMSNEQANEFIQRVTANPPPTELQSLFPVPGASGGGGVNMDDLLQRMMMQQRPGPLPMHSNPWAAVANPWAGPNSGAASASVTTTPTDPRVRFQRQLAQLREMGFDQDEPRNLEALSIMGGNINRAVDWLLAHPVTDTTTATSTGTETTTSSGETVGDNTNSEPSQDETQDEAMGDNQNKE